MTDTHSESGAAGRILDWIKYSWELPAALCVLAVGSVLFTAAYGLVGWRTWALLVEAGLCAGLAWLNYHDIRPVEVLADG